MHRKLDELFLQIHITGRCNLACRHCYQSGAAQDMDPALFRECLNQFGELRETVGARRCWVQVTGGEPLLHPDIPGMLRDASHRMPVRVLTNGTLLDPDLSQTLARTCVSVQVSFDGPRDQHDSWRGDGAFDAAFSGLRSLKANGARTSARVTVGRDNQRCVTQLLDQLGSRIDGFAVSRVVPMGACEVELPDTSEYRRLMYRLYSAHFSDSRISLRDPFFGVLMNPDYPRRAFHGCAAGISGICVTETGDVYPCRRLPIRLGNVSEDSLIKLYFDHPLMIDLRERQLAGRCGACEDRLRCGGSRCIAFAVTGDPLAEDPGCIFACDRAGESMH